MRKKNRPLSTLIFIRLRSASVLSDRTSSKSTFRHQSRSRANPASNSISPSITSTNLPLNNIHQTPLNNIHQTPLSLLPFPLPLPLSFPPQSFQNPDTYLLSPPNIKIKTPYFKPTHPPSPSRRFSEEDL